MLCAVVLCKNESVHISRCIESLLELTTRIFIVDSYSEDNTLEILSKYPCIVKHHPFSSHSDQFNWAMDNLPWLGVSWVLRLDADEYLGSKFVSQLFDSQALNSSSIQAISVKRSFVVDGYPVRYGSLTTRCIRIVRSHVRYPLQIMDEHFDVPCSCVFSLDSFIYDYNLKSFSWWLYKHYFYSKKEAIQYLSSRPYWSSLYPELLALSKKFTLQQRFYYKLPPFLRSFVFFLVRYLVFLGFLNRPSASRFIFFQCLAYRLLVDFWIVLYQFDAIRSSYSSLEFDLETFC